MRFVAPHHKWKYTGVGGEIKLFLVRRSNLDCAL